MAYRVRLTLFTSPSPSPPPIHISQCRIIELVKNRFVDGALLHMVILHLHIISVAVNTFEKYVVIQILLVYIIMLLLICDPVHAWSNVTNWRRAMRVIWS